MSVFGRALVARWLKRRSFWNGAPWWEAGLQTGACAVRLFAAGGRTGSFGVEILILSFEAAGFMQRKGGHTRVPKSPLIF